MIKDRSHLYKILSQISKFEKVRFKSEPIYPESTVILHQWTGASFGGSDFQEKLFEGEFQLCMPIESPQRRARLARNLRCLRSSAFLRCLEGWSISSSSTSHG